MCAALLPDGAEVSRPPCSTPGGAPDLLARVAGTGRRRVLLLGHVDTVVSHQAHLPLRRDGDRLYGPGTADMKGGVVLALGVMRALTEDPTGFGELAILLVTDEEWRTQPFRHARELGAFDACLCFEAGERGPEGQEGVVVKRKAAGTLRVGATGRSAHSGSAPDQGANALLALAQVAIDVSVHHAPSGPDRLSVVPTVLRSGDAFNVVPAQGELIFDLRADRVSAFEDVLAAVPESVGEVRVEARMERVWPGMNSRQSTEQLLREASRRAGPPGGRSGSGRGQRREPFCPPDPVDGRRTRPPGRGRPHAGGVRA